MKSATANFELGYEVIVEEDEGPILMNPDPEPTVSPMETFFNCWKCKFKDPDKDVFYAHFSREHGKCHNISGFDSGPRLGSKPESAAQNRGSNEFASSSSWLLNTLASGNRCLDCGNYYKDIMSHIKDVHLKMSPVADDDPENSLKEMNEDETVVVISEVPEEVVVLTGHQKLTKLESDQEDITRFRIDQFVDEKKEEFAIQESTQKFYVVSNGGELVQLDPVMDLEEIAAEETPATNVVKKVVKQGTDRQFTLNKMNDGSRIFTCDLCHFQSKFRGTMHDHMNAVHRKIKHKCSECSFETLYKKTLFYHRTKKHGKKALKCVEPSCSFKTILENKFNEHLSTKHNMMTLTAAPSIEDAAIDVITNEEDFLLSANNKYIT